jgi:8-amino-7-oxononanoate synthase
MARLDVEKSGATTVVLDGRELTYFGGCGYLGLAHHRRVVDAARAGLERFGVSSGASRETSGNARAHDELELRLARELGVEAALLTPEGYTANLALAQGLANDCRAALIDELAHSSLFDAAHAVQLEVVTYAHGDVAAAERGLRARVGVALMTDSVFPSRGEIAPLAELHAVAQRAHAWLVIDDCHGTGVIGARGRGALEHAAIAGERIALTTTLSKALGCYGGVVAGSRALIERVRETSHAYIGTTPIPPAIACAALAALELAFGSDELVRAMRSNVVRAREGFERLGLSVSREQLPVLAFELESAAAMQRLHSALRSDGLLVPYVLYPGGGAAGNLRAVVTAAHRPDEIERLLAALARHLPAAVRR